MNLKKWKWKENGETVGDRLSDSLKAPVKFHSLWGGRKKVFQDDFIE